MIERDRESRQQHTLEWQRTKFNKLWHKSKGGHSNSYISKHVYRSLLQHHKYYHIQQINNRNNIKTNEYFGNSNNNRLGVGQELI